jgi:hypothetical protein
MAVGPLRAADLASVLFSRARVFSPTMIQASPEMGRSLIIRNRLGLMEECGLQKQEPHSKINDRVGACGA